MKSKSITHVVALAAIICGLSLQTYQLVFLSGGPMNAFLFGLMAWSMLPYVICSVLLFRFHLTWAAAVAGCLALGADLGMHYSVFIKPAGSTAAVGLLFMPAVNLAITLTVGLLAGWLHPGAQKPMHCLELPLPVVWA